ncbi:C40 family peptidase [Deinococcus sedimenti]|uniref:Peptidase n=1 Tax=Deinococcus sedimenti TaxID=1867090 RepID=A0ABQ2S7J9_9DEIO|nr:LysM peptidoglycan-binding domain-containing protein [Deinococcus sedimenti]GGR94624.1 peptidase [Deinococcus sedimenti]
MPDSRFLPLCLLLGALLVGRADAQAVFTEPSAPPAPVADSPAGGSLDGLLNVTVQPGDTAFSIARRAGLSVADLLALNHLGAPNLRVGQVLILRVTPVTYTVQPGDTLYALARRFGVSVDALLGASALPAGSVLKTGQVLTLPTGAAATAPAAAAVASVAPSAAASRVTTQSLPAVTSPGGPLGSPFQPQAPTQSVPVLQPGTPMPRTQAPGLPSPAPAAQATVSPATVAGAGGADWRAAALSLLNTPYLLGGTTRSGTDCSGLVLQVFTPLGVTLPRTSAEQARTGQPIPTEALEPGDLVFFDTAGAGRVSHVGIYLGEDQFISANSYQGRVTVDRLLSDRYWAPRFLGARRVLGSVNALASGR